MVVFKLRTVSTQVNFLHLYMKYLKLVTKYTSDFKKTIVYSRDARFSWMFRLLATALSTYHVPSH